MAAGRSSSSSSSSRISRSSREGGLRAAGASVEVQAKVHAHDVTILNELNTLMNVENKMNAVSSVEMMRIALVASILHSTKAG